MFMNSYGDTTYLKDFLLYPRKGSWTMLLHPMRTIRNIQRRQRGFEQLMAIAKWPHNSRDPIYGPLWDYKRPIITLMDILKRPIWTIRMLLKCRQYGMGEATLMELEEQELFSFSELEENLARKPGVSVTGYENVFDTSDREFVSVSQIPQRRSLGGYREKLHHGDEKLYHGDYQSFLDMIGSPADVRKHFELLRPAAGLDTTYKTPRYKLGGKPNAQIKVFKIMSYPYRNRRRRHRLRTKLICAILNAEKA